MIEKQQHLIKKKQKGETMESFWALDRSCCYWPRH